MLNYVSSISKKLKFSSLLIGLTAILMTNFLSPTSALAQSELCNTQREQTEKTSLFNPDLGYNKIVDCLPVSRFDNRSIGSLINSVLSTLNFIIGFLALFGLIVSGIMYITAGGDQAKAEKARHNIVWIIIGIFIYMLALYFLPIIRAIIRSAI